MWWGKWLFKERIKHIFEKMFFIRYQSAILCMWWRGNDVDSSEDMCNKHTCQHVSIAWWLWWRESICLLFHVFELFVDACRCSVEGDNQVISCQKINWWFHFYKKDRGNLLKETMVGKLEWFLVLTCMSFCCRISTWLGVTQLFSYVKFLANILNWHRVGQIFV